MLLRSRRCSVNRYNELTRPCRRDGIRESSIVATGAERDPTGVQRRRSFMFSGTGEPVRLRVCESLLAVEWRPQQVDIKHQSPSGDKCAAMSVSHRTHTLWCILLAGLPNDAMAVHPPRRHRQRVQKFTQPRATGRRKSFAHIDSLNCIATRSARATIGHRRAA